MDEFNTIREILLERHDNIYLDTQEKIDRGFATDDVKIPSQFASERKNLVGVLDWKGKKNLESVYIFNVPSYDHSILPKGKPVESPSVKVFRYASYSATTVGKMMPFIRIDFVRGLVYFAKDLDSDKLEWDRKGEKLKYLRVSPDALKGLASGIENSF